MKVFVNIFLVFSIIINIQGQSINFKEEALKVAKKGNYSEAIKLLRKAEKQNPKDPDIYYYIGVFMHYQAYDSTPLIGYDSTYTNKVLFYLKKSIKLKPDYGNAYYFIGSQYTGSALDAMQSGNENGYKTAFRKAYNAGAFPKWLLEYDRNILKSCDKNAILFVGGDAEFNPMQYLQAIENYRKDVTVIPIGLLNRPWYIKILKKGFGEILGKIQLNISEKQIMDMHPYKWDTTKVNIPISAKLKTKYKLSSDESMQWEIVPDLKSTKGTFLSNIRAILFIIIKSNKWERPVYFTLGCQPSFYSGIEKHLQSCGLVLKLFPIMTDKITYKINVSTIERILLNSNNFKFFYDVEKHNMPRISYILGNYYYGLYELAYYYKFNNQVEKITKLEKFIKKYLHTKYLPSGNNILQMMDKIAKN